MATDKSKKHRKKADANDQHSSRDKKKGGKKFFSEKAGDKHDEQLQGNKSDDVGLKREDFKGDKEADEESTPAEANKISGTSAGVDSSNSHEESVGQKVVTIIGDAIKKVAEKILPHHSEHEGAQVDDPQPTEVAENTEPNSAEINEDSATLKVTFKVKYSTVYGQNLFVTGNHELLGNNDLSRAFPMTYFNAEYWIAELEISKGVNQNIVYNYYLKLEDGSDTLEWGRDKFFNPSAITNDKLMLLDVWNYAGLYENVFYSEPFKEVLLKENFTAVTSSSREDFTHTFKVKAPLLVKGQVLFIAGNVPELNNWSITDPLLLSREQDEDWWQININLSTATFPIQYKYGVYNLYEKKLVQYESGGNRVFAASYDSDALTVVSDGFAHLPNNTFKGAGVAIPVFSLRTANSFGVGEFNDMKLLVDWAKSVGLKLVQILPINDTTATYTFADSYPYAAISAFALHPIYLNLASIVSEENEALLTSVQDRKAQLNALDAINYSEVLAAKLDFVKQVFPIQKEEVFNTSDFKTFFQSNAHWLIPYAAFSHLRDKYQTANFTKWPTDQTYNSAAINELAGDALKADESISIYYFIQYHLHLQLKAATDYAHKNGIIVKGDIPIGIFRNSCDAWQEPELYNMDLQAGAPPDDFAIKGQNWGFPTYNWQKMALDGFNWWKRRFAQMSYYFDAFRIDHILGFFRIWSIPLDSVEGIMGYFVPALPVHISEFHQRGISFDVERFAKPFINDAILWDLFGNEANPVKRQFLIETGNGTYQVLPDFNTQRKVENYFASLEQSSFNKKLKQGLFDILSNVLLFEVEGSQGQQFHFRISIESTTSFKNLDEGTRAALKDLYINYFYRRQDDFWKKEAMMKLPELKRSTNMLICGEDLGMVPASVPGVMRDLAILSLEIQRMPKDPTLEFFNPKNAPYLSVVTPSTHDMSTIRGWWEEERVKTQKFYIQELGQAGEAPYFCEPWINQAIIVQHLFSPAMWSIFQLQDLLGIDGKIRRSNPNDERINIPANPKHYWQYRMHLTIEDLMEQTELNTELKNLVAGSGRL